MQEQKYLLQQVLLLFGGYLSIPVNALLLLCIMKSEMRIGVHRDACVLCGEDGMCMKPMKGDAEKSERKNRK